jgi:hypothetical protein
MFRRFTTRRRTGVFSLAVVVAITGSALAALSPITSSPARTSAAQPRELTRAQLFAKLEERGRQRTRLTAKVADVVVSQARQSLSIFARARTATDAVSQAQAVILPEPVEAQQSRLAFSADGNAVYLVPSAEGVCISDTNDSQDGCLSMSMVREGGAAESTECGRGLPNTETVEVAGVVSDQAREPTAILSNGARTPLTVTNDVFLADFPRKGPLPTQIEVRMPTGPHFFSSTVPADASTEHCVTP